MQELKVTPVPGACGAEIGGIDLARPLADATIDAIRVAFVEHHVLFFRKQHLDPAQQVAFGARFGELEDYPFVAYFGNDVSQADSR